MSNTKVIIVADESVHQFLTEKYPEWDTQTPVTSIDALWDGLNDDTLSSDESRIVLFSDQYLDLTGANNDLEVAVATMAPRALVGVIYYEESARNIIEERVRAAARSNQMERAKIYYIFAQTPEDDIDAALADYQQRMGPTAQAAVSPRIEADVTPTIAPQKQKPRKGMVICCTSSKGGSGKSSTSILLASELARASRKSVELGVAKRPLDVIVVDMDVREGQIGFLIGQISPTVLNLRLSGSLDPNSIRRFLVRDDRLGFHALLAAKRGRSADNMTPEFYRAVIEELRTMFDIVILDTSANYLDPLLEHVCYPIADAILFVTDLGPSSVFGMGRWFQEVVNSKEDGGMGIDKRKIGVVVNRSMTNVGMKKDQIIEAAMESPVLTAVPNKQRAFVGSANNFRLDTLLEDPEVERAFFRLASSILGNKYKLSPLTSGVVSPTAGGEDLGDDSPTTVPAKAAPQYARPEAQPNGQPTLQATPVARQTNQRRGFFRR